MKVVISETQLKRLVNIISEGSDKKKNVLFVGDSLSAGRGYTWNYLLADKHPDWNVTHIVEGGKRTDWMLDNLKTELKKKKYDLVFIWGGTNDMFSLVSIGSAISNLQRMADEVIAQGGKPIIFAGYDVKSVMTDEKLTPTIYCDYRCMIKSRNRMIDFQDKLEQGISGAKVISRIKDSSIKAGDGVHIGGVGHKIIADYVDTKLSSTISDIDKLDKKASFGLNWVDTLKNYLGKTFKSFFGSEKTLTKKLVDDLETLKENKIYTKKEFLLNEDKTLQYEKGFIEYKPKVEPLQITLQLLGYSLPNWGVDGKFGPETKKAIEDFQIDNDMKPTGKVTPEVTKKLIEKIKSENITDQDFAKLNVTKTEKYTDKGSKSKVSNVQLKGKDFESFAIERNGDEFLERVKEIGRNVGLDYNLILATMFFESKMDPAAQNPVSLATGLIQFMPFTAKSLDTSIESLRSMSALDQLDYVEKFYRKNGNLISKIKSPEEAYFLVFYPAALLHNDDFVLGSEVSPQRARLIKNQNAPFDTNSDGGITKGEIKQFVRKKWGIG